MVHGCVDDRVHASTDTWRHIYARKCTHPGRPNARAMFPFCVVFNYFEQNETFFFRFLKIFWNILEWSGVEIYYSGGTPEWLLIPPLCSQSIKLMQKNNLLKKLAFCFPEAGFGSVFTLPQDLDRSALEELEKLVLERVSPQVAAITSYLRRMKKNTEHPPCSVGGLT